MSLWRTQHFVDKYNLLYVYPVDARAGHVRSGGQMGGTVHDMVLFSLCFMQLGMAAFFKVPLQASLPPSLTHSRPSPSWSLARSLAPSPKGALSLSR